MADDQAKLDSFADADDAESTADESRTAGAGESDDDGDRTDADSTDADRTDGDDGADQEDGVPSDEGRVCPWCLAGADRFVETGPTGLACDRCSGALPVGMDWFDAREAVARRPMYETD